MKRPQVKSEEKDWIESYVLGKMSQDDSRHFEDEMAHDTKLAFEHKTQQKIHLFLQQAFLEESAMDTIKKLQRQDRRKVKLIPLYRLLAVAASVSVLFVAYLSLSIPEFPDSENDFTVVRSTNASSMPPGQRIVFDQFFDGQAHIVEGQYIMAVRNFENVLEAQNLRPYFREAAQWHLILAYLKSGDISRAKNLYEHFENCLDCEYQVSPINRWKIWWQIYWQKMV